MNDKNLLPMEKFNLIWPCLVCYLFFSLFFFIQCSGHPETACYNKGFVSSDQGLKEHSKNWERRPRMTYKFDHTYTYYVGLTHQSSPSSIQQIHVHLSTVLSPTWIMEVCLAVLVCHDLTTGFQKFWFIKKLVVHSAFPTMRGTKYKIPLGWQQNPSFDFV